MKKVSIYTDGACSGNPGKGGWGAVLVYNGTEKEMSGFEAETTNNRMELTAVIRALAALREPCLVTLTTDSKYVCDAVTKGWVYGWQRKGWRKADGKPALNVDLWQQLLPLFPPEEPAGPGRPSILPPRARAAPAGNRCSVRKAARPAPAAARAPRPRAPEMSFSAAVLSRAHG